MEISFFLIMFKTYFLLLFFLISLNLNSQSITDRNLKKDTITYELVIIDEYGEKLQQNISKCIKNTDTLKDENRKEFTKLKKVMIVIEVLLLIYLFRML